MQLLPKSGHKNQVKLARLFRFFTFLLFFSLAFLLSLSFFRFIHDAHPRISRCYRCSRSVPMNSIRHREIMDTIPASIYAISGSPIFWLVRLATVFHPINQTGRYSGRDAFSLYPLFFPSDYVSRDSRKGTRLSTGVEEEVASWIDEDGERTRKNETRIFDRSSIKEMEWAGTQNGGGR